MKKCTYSLLSRIISLLFKRQASITRC